MVKIFLRKCRPCWKNLLPHHVLLSPKCRIGQHHLRLHIAVIVVIPSLLSLSLSLSSSSSPHPNMVDCWVAVIVVVVIIPSLFALSLALSHHHPRPIQKLLIVELLSSSSSFHHFSLSLSCSLSSSSSSPHPKIVDCWVAVIIESPWTWGLYKQGHSLLDKLLIISIDGWHYCDTKYMKCRDFREVDRKISSM